MTIDTEERGENIRMLRDSAAAVADRGDLSRIRRLRFTSPGFDRAVWQQMAELGWTGLRRPVGRGGAGLGMAEYCALAEELGAALVPEPLIAGVLAVEVLDGAALREQLDGKALFLPAWQEQLQTLDCGETRFDGGRLTGCKRFVGGAEGADGFVVATAQGAVLVEAGAPGLTIRPVPAQDGGRIATLAFRDTPARPLAGDFRAALEDATLATAAYLLGVIEAALERTIDYLGTRTQFGVVIGSFQALQHAAVDMKVQAALTRASLGAAAALVDAGAGPGPRQAAVSRAKARASGAAMQVTQAAIQLHGGIGFSDEHDIGLFLRKAMVLAPAYGGAALHRRRHACLAIATAGDAPRSAESQLEGVQ